MLPDESVLPNDEFSRRLLTLEADLRDQLQAVAAVERSAIAPWLSVVTLTPTNPNSLPVSWVEGEDELGLQAGHNGGRWELDRNDNGATFIERAVAAVIAGQVTETFAPGRSCVRITMLDGTFQQETGFEGCLSVLVPMPGWKRWGRTVSYMPYR